MGNARQFRLVLDDEYAHDAEVKAVKGSKKPRSSGKAKDGQPEIMRKTEAWLDKLSRRLVKQSRAMLYTLHDFEVTPGISDNENIANLKFNILFARERRDYYQGLIRLMENPTGPEAEKRRAKRVAGKPIIIAVYFNKIEFNDVGRPVVTMEDAKEEVVMTGRRLRQMEADMQEVREILAAEEMQAAQKRHEAFVEATASMAG